MQFLYSEDDNEDTEGNCKKGSFHSDLLIGEIPDEVIEDPSTALLPLFYKEDQSGIHKYERGGNRGVKTTSIGSVYQRCEVGWEASQFFKTSIGSNRRVFANLRLWIKGHNQIGRFHSNS